MNSLLSVVLFSCMVSCCFAICWTSGPYHLAAAALAVGVGNLSSASVCVYGPSDKLNSECPLPCQALITATWGDCYCRDPDYHPYATGADNFIYPLGVDEVFKVLATTTYWAGATCRNWLQTQNSSWTCQS